MPNPADRRSVLVEITPAGRATTDQLLPGMRTLERGILSALTPDERAHLLDMLRAGWPSRSRSAGYVARPVTQTEMWVGSKA